MIKPLVIVISLFLSGYTQACGCPFTQFERVQEIPFEQVSTFLRRHIPENYVNNMDALDQDFLLRHALYNKPVDSLRARSYRVNINDASFKDSYVKLVGALKQCNSFRKSGAP